MSIIRVQKTNNYTVMSNYHLRDKTISLKAKGLMSQMLSLPDDWDYSIKGLAAINKEAESAIETALKELKKAGYLVVSKVTPDKTDSGRYEYIYDLYEHPQEVEQEGEKQGVEILPLEIQGVENHPLNKDKEKPNKDKQSKEDKESIRSIIFTASENGKHKELEEALNEFVKMRQKIRKPVTERALKIIINKCYELARGEHGMMVKILDRSIVHSWQDVYPYEDDSMSRTQMTARVQTAEARIDNPFTALKREEGL